MEGIKQCSVRHKIGNHTMGNEFRCLLVTDATLNEYLLLTGIFDGHHSVNESPSLQHELFSFGERKATMVTHEMENHMS